MEPRIATVDDLIEYVDVEDRQGKEHLLKRYLVACEVAAERRARRHFSPTPVEATDPPVTKTFTTRGRSIVRVPDLRIVTSLTLGGLVLGVDDWDPGPGDMAETPTTHITLPYTGRDPSRRFGQVSRIGGFYRDDLVITGHWGFPGAGPTHDAICHAICLIAAKSWKRRDSGFADLAVDEQTGAVKVAKAWPEEARDIIDSFRVRHMAFV